MNEQQKKSQIKVVVCQFGAVYKNVQESQKKANLLLEKYSIQDNIDFLLLPQMAFVGYKFNDKQDIEPFVQFPQEGSTFKWSCSQALRLNCYVAVGYPQKRIESPDTGVKYYNSQMLVNPHGKLVTSYAKHFLYPMDEKWSEQGPSFEANTLTIQKKNNIQLKVAHAICMDISPYKFLDNDKYQLSEFLAKTVRELEEMKKQNQVKDQPQRYWTKRAVYCLKSSPKPLYFCAANRVGIEQGHGYTGGSCFIKLNKTFQESEMMDTLSYNEEGSLVQSFAL